MLSRPDFSTTTPSVPPARESDPPSRDRRLVLATLVKRLPLPSTARRAAPSALRSLLTAASSEPAAVTLALAPETCASSAVVTVLVVNPSRATDAVPVKLPWISAMPPPKPSVLDVASSRPLWSVVLLLLSTA